MRYTVLFSILLFAILTGCTKDKFESTPSLKFKSVSSTRVPAGSLVKFYLTFTDAEGDISGSIYVEKIEPNCPNSNFTDFDSIPSYPTSKNQKGEIVVTYGNNSDDPSFQNISPKCSQNDTAIFRFAIKDKANHISDTVSSPPVILYYQ